MNEKLEALVAEAKAAGAKEAINKQELADKSEPHERKMRFDVSERSGGHAFGASSADALIKKTSGSFVRKGDRQREYGLEELALGRLILSARGEVLPDAMEEKFQSLADRAKRYTMTTGGAGTGAELTDTILWSQLFEDIHASTLVADLFRPFIEMSAGKMELSEMGDAIFYKPGGEGEAVTATDLVTAKRALTAYTIKAQVDVSDEEDEDSIVGALMSIRQKLIRGSRELIDEVILNADASTGTQNINYYAASGGANIATTSRFLVGFDGLAHYCLSEVTGQKTDIGALDTDDFAGLIGKLGKYADNPERCAFIIDRGVKNKAMQLDDFQTMDKIGAQATLLRGMVGGIYGVPVVMCPQIAASNTTGQVDQTPGNNVKGRIVLVNRDLWKVGMRRSIRVATQRDEAKTLTSIVASMRIALQCFGDRSSADYCHTALGYNVTV